MAAFREDRCVRIYVRLSEEKRRSNVGPPALQNMRVCMSLSGRMGTCPLVPWHNLQLKRNNISLCLEIF